LLGQPSSATAEELPISDPAKVLRIPVVQPSGSAFLLLQQWEGTVMNAEALEFVANLRDLTDASRPEEAAAFPLDEVPEPDRPLVVPGAVFYWTIGYETAPTGTRKTVSMLRFRRLPAWSRSELRRLKVEAATFRKVLEPTA
jgi:hypothetical protein